MQLGSVSEAVEVTAEAPQLKTDGTTVIRSTRFNQKAPIVFAISANTPADYKQAMKDGETHGTLDAAGFKARLEKDVAFWRPMIKKLGIPMAN